MAAKIGMNWEEIMDFLKEQEIEMKRMKKVLEKSLKAAPDGHIEVKMCKGKYPQYYFSDQRHKKEYIRKKEQEKIRPFIQKEYEQKCLKALDQNSQAVKEFLAQIIPDAIGRIMKDEPEIRRQWIRPLEMTVEEYKNNWRNDLEKKKQEAGNGYPIPEGIYTDKGEAVRSKSEKIIADKLDRMEIPYVYEAPLMLRGWGLVYPDFTLLDISHRKTVYFEHFGRTDDPEYCLKTLKKIQAYNTNEHWFGGNLLYTFETLDYPLNTNYLEHLLNRFLC